MPDKFKDTFPVPISFVSGEQPSAAKLTAWALQTNAALNQIENALGDMHSDFFPLFGSTNTPSGKWSYGKDGVALDAIQTHLQILNLARLVGPASALNPRILGHHTATITDEPLPSDVNEFYLRFRPAGTVTFSLAKFATPVAGPALVTIYGEYYVDALTGKVVVWDGSGGNGTVTYSIKTTTDNLLDTYHEAYFNVCPAPQQAVKCTIAASGSDWRITLPVVTHQQGNWTETSTALTAQNDPNFNAQLSLPLWLSNEYVASDVIADGLLAVWDEEERRVINGAFKFVSATEVDYDGDTGEVLVAGSDRYSLLVSGGTDITRTIDNLRSRYRVHTHDGTNGDMRVPHENLDTLAVGWVTSDTGGPSYSFFDDGANKFPNHHPQYLGRWGLDSSVSRNAMLGDLLLGTVPNAGNLAPLFGTSFYSHRIHFGDTTGPTLRYDHTAGGLHLANNDLVLANDYKFDSARSTSVVLDGGVGVWDENIPSVPERKNSGGSHVIVSTNADAQIIYFDVNQYLPEGATITSVDVGLQFGPGPNDREVTVRVYEDGFAAANITLAGGDTATALGYSSTPNLVFSHTVDKTQRTILGVIPGWTGGVGITYYCYIIGIRINFTHDTIHRGG